MQFVIKKDGRIDQVKVFRGVDPLLDAEAVRLISAMPNLKLGVNEGVMVPVIFTIPISYKNNPTSAKSSSSSKMPEVMLSGEHNPNAYI